MKLAYMYMHTAQHVLSTSWVSSSALTKLNVVAIAGQCAVYMTGSNAVFTGNN